MFIALQKPDQCDDDDRFFFSHFHLQKKKAFYFDQDRLLWKCMKWHRVLPLKCFSGMCVVDASREHQKALTGSPATKIPNTEYNIYSLESKTSTRIAMFQCSVINVIEFIAKSTSERPTLARWHSNTICSGKV